MSGAAYFQCLGRFNEAWKRRDAGLALDQARAIRARGAQLQIADAMRLVILLGRSRHPLFQASAKRWIARLSEEGRPLVDLQIAAAAISGLQGESTGDRCERILIHLLAAERTR